jgi:heptosyltransferase-2
MNIALFVPNWVGDAVMATPALRAVHDHFAGARLIAVLKPYVAGVLEGSPWFARQIHLDNHGPWSARWPGVALALRRERIDLAILFPNTLRSALVAWLGGCKRRIGFARYGRSPLLTDRLEPLRDIRGRLVPTPALDSYNLLAQEAGCPRPSRRMVLFTTPGDEAAVDRLWQETGLHHCREVICLNPGAAFGAAKYWPADYFATLAQELADQRGSGILVLCGPSERALAANIARLANRPLVHSLSDIPLSLGLTKACVKRAALLVTTDSGPRHFAAAFNRPVVTLFGPTHIAWTETYHPGAIHLQREVDCGPCQKRVCPLDHRCMTTLTAGEVFHAAVRLLDRNLRIAA